MAMYQEEITLHQIKMVGDFEEMALYHKEMTLYHKEMVGT